MMRKFSTLFILALLLCTSLQSYANDAIKNPDLFQAHYTAKYGSFTIKATRTLRQLDNGHHELAFKAHHWLAKIDEVSQFSIDNDGQLVPQHYTYKRTGLGRNRTAILDFDWQTNRVSNNVQNKPWSMALPDDTLDKLSYQLQLRSDLLNNKDDMKYQVADGGRLKTYTFEVLGEETLDTPTGKLSTIKIKRLRNHGKRVTYLWLAIDWNYMLVRLQQKESDGKQYEINLTAATLNGQSVVGP